MEIIIAGDLSQLKTIKVTCRKCNTIFRAYETECVKSLVIDKIYAYSVKCPVCSFTNIDLEEEYDQG